MPDLKVVIVDYGLGNIFSIQRAIACLGKEALITGDHWYILDADRLILPGVGSFAQGRKALSENGLDGVLVEYSATQRPVMGVCLGMQLLMSVSEEFGRHQGLGLIPGRVSRLPSGAYYKVPHVGWNQVFPPEDKSIDIWSGTVLRGNSAGDFFYFAHSYIVVPEDHQDVLAQTQYGGIKFCSALRKGNIFGCQFHPELSSEAGLRVYREFLDMPSFGNYSAQEGALNRKSGLR